MGHFDMSQSISFLFWNIMKANLESAVQSLCDEHDIDIVVLAECKFDVDGFRSQLCSSGLKDWNYITPIRNAGSLHVFGRSNRVQLSSQYDDSLGRTHMFRLKPLTAPEVLLVTNHSPSKMNFSEGGQWSLAGKLSEEIDKVEADTGISRTIFVGDLNMNPFESGVVNALGLHALMHKGLVKRRKRTVQGIGYKYFYNPMWGHFGDRTDGPAGTYYYSSGEPVNHFWNMYDQVLLRPDIMNSLDSLRILSSVGGQSLLTTGGVPNKTQYSDHLPIVFRISV